jgi:hypothetical protein
MWESSVRDQQTELHVAATQQQRMTRRMHAQHGATANNSKEQDKRERERQRAVRTSQRMRSEVPGKLPGRPPNVLSLLYFFKPPLPRPAASPPARRARDPVSWVRRRFTIFWIRRAATTGSSCSQTRTTCQPSSANRRSVSRSRISFLRSLSLHQAAFAFGLVRWIGHECQKQPSTITATRAGPKTMSALRRRPEIGLLLMR